MEYTFKQIKAGERIMLGRIMEAHNYDGKQVIQLSDKNFYARKGGGELPSVARRPYVEVYKVEDTMCMLHLSNHTCTTIEPISIPDQALAKLREAARAAAENSEAQ